MSVEFLQLFSTETFDASCSYFFPFHFLISETIVYIFSKGSLNFLFPLLQGHCHCNTCSVFQCVEILQWIMNLAIIINSFPIIPFPHLLFFLLLLLFLGPSLHWWGISFIYSPIFWTLLSCFSASPCSEGFPWLSCRMLIPSSSRPFQRVWLLTLQLRGWVTFTDRFSLTMLGWEAGKGFRDLLPANIKNLCIHCGEC